MKIPCPKCTGMAVQDENGLNCGHCGHSSYERPARVNNAKPKGTPIVKRTEPLRRRAWAKPERD